MNKRYKKYDNAPPNVIGGAFALSLKRKKPPLKVVEIKIFKIQEKSSCGILGVEVTGRNEEKTTGGFL